MEEIILDERDFSTPAEVHELLADALDFPEYYGQNLSALWDCLDELDFPICFTVVRSSEKKDWFDKFVTVLSRAKSQVEGINLIIKQA